MKQLQALLLGCGILCTSVVLADPPAEPVEITAAEHAEAERLEKSLQGLNWEQFRTVVNSIPKLKADVDAYGSFGWEFVKANYQQHKWRKNILKMDAGQRKQLDQLIRKTQKPATPANKKAAR